jgi:hypothetical protein
MVTASCSSRVKLGYCQPGPAPQDDGGAQHLPTFDVQ